MAAVEALSGRVPAGGVQLLTVSIAAVCRSPGTVW